MHKQKKGQVWIETVTYTLVAFVLIGLVLAYAKPKIEELQDQAIIEQSIKMIKQVDSTIQEISEEGVGNKRKIEFTLKKGEFEINAVNDSLIFYLNEGSYMFSQPGQEYTEAGLKILTEEQGKNYNVRIEKEYETLNLTYGGKEEVKKVLKGATPYTMYITNKGGTDKNIDFIIE